MKASNYKQLVELVRSNSRMMIHRGLTIEVKPVPDSEREHDLDPRVMGVMLEQMKNDKSPPRHEKNGRPPLDVEQIRTRMGWPNTDILSSRVDVEDLIVEGRNGGIPIRIYRPEGTGPKPIVVFFHGGGFIGGSTGAVENPCKFLSEQADAIVVNVDYRLAPEHPFPAGLYDCFDSVRWAYVNAEAIGGTSDWLAVAGDSAGGNLTAVCAIMDRDLGMGMIKFQALIYPALIMVGAQAVTVSHNQADPDSYSYHEANTHTGC